MCIYTYIQVLLGSLTGVRAFYLPGKTHTHYVFLYVYFFCTHAHTLSHTPRTHTCTERGVGGVRATRSKPGDVVNSVGA